MEVNAGVVVGFWREAGPERWFARSDAFDAQCAALVRAHHRGIGQVQALTGDISCSAHDNSPLKINFAMTAVYN